jgi:hypothetical protein
MVATLSYSETSLLIRRAEQVTRDIHAGCLREKQRGHILDKFEAELEELHMFDYVRIPSTYVEHMNELLAPLSLTDRNALGSCGTGAVIAGVIDRVFALGE